MFWPFLGPWAIVSAAFYWRRWRPGLHLSGLALTGFVVLLGYHLDDGHAHGLVVAIGLAVAGVAVAGERLRPDLQGSGRACSTTASSSASPASSPCSSSRIRSSTSSRFWPCSPWHLTVSPRFSGAAGPATAALLWLGYVGFSFEILAIYSKTIGTLLNTSLFFLVAGLIVAGLAAMAYRLHAQGEAKEVQS